MQLNPWEPVADREMAVVGRRNQFNVLVVRIGYKPGVGYLRRNNSGYGPPWMRAGTVDPEVATMLLELTAAREAAQ